MHIYRLRAAYDESGNSPWDALWYDGEDEDLDALECQMRLAPIWKPPAVVLEKRKATPDIFVFQIYFATTKRVCDVLSPFLGDTVEFLPIKVAKGKTFYAIHPLLRIDLDERAETNAEPNDNITVIRKYSFKPGDFEDDMHLFQILQAQGSSARNGGYPCSGILASGQFKEVCELNHLTGVKFESVWQSKK